MPVKDQTIYPPYWKQFSLYIRTERSGGVCEECGLENGAIGFRIDGNWHYSQDYLAVKKRGAGFYRTDGYSKVVLTVAHLDAIGDVCRCQDETGFLCANPAHVKAMCQGCHNRYDGPKRSANRAVTAAAKKDAARELFA